MCKNSYNICAKIFSYCAKIVPYFANIFGFAALIRLNREPQISKIEKIYATIYYFEKNGILNVREGGRGPKMTS